MKCFSLILTLLLLTSCSVTQKQKENLKNELSLILKSDQELRELFTPDLKPERKNEILKSYNISEDKFQKFGWNLTVKNDSINLIKVEKIIKKYGYPGKKLVGEKLNTAVWYVIQHSKLPVIEKYYPLMIKASENGDLGKEHIVMMKDRMLMYQGKEQIYGTQGAGRLFINPETKKEEWVNFIWPIKNPENVNELRKSMNIKTSIEDYAKSMGIDYSKKYTLDEIEKLTKK
ncbi:hypothetical protein PG291_00180 [Riemerella anatipestifer]|nr:hypothetical protein [Riemerella anatipestifer]